MRTPSSPWTRVVRITIPLSSCDNAATYLIQALGGEDHARTVVGGVKWWQVRGLEGYDSEYIVICEGSESDLPQGRSPVDHRQEGLA